MSSPVTEPPPRTWSRTWSRRRLLAAGAGGAAAALLGGLELVAHGVLPGQHALDELEGACTVAVPPETLAPAGPVITGRFFSRARNRTVGYTIAYPPGHAPGSRLALGVVLHAFGGDHTSRYGGLSLASALAARTGAASRAPIALVAADGGGLYWNAHPGDDPMAMLVDELIPLCRRQGLGRGPGAIGATGISMGGYGALLLAEHHPGLIAAVAAISPAVWTSYAQARAANPGAYASAADFAADDVVTHASALAGIPVRVAAGADDPFRPGVEALAARLPRSAIVEIAPGCHDGAFFAAHQHASLAFLASHLTRGAVD
ncbi:MAG: alpha/beta hydrolase-fold protein [Solirubrobacteraceae bacterium]|jgi:pimeloyl-ACP methyl ester carboxylesterase